MMQLPPLFSLTRPLRWFAVLVAALTVASMVLVALPSFVRTTPGAKRPTSSLVLGAAIDDASADEPAWPDGCGGIELLAIDEWLRHTRMSPELRVLLSRIEASAWQPFGTSSVERPGPFSQGPFVADDEGHWRTSLWTSQCQRRFTLRTAGVYEMRGAREVFIGPASVTAIDCSAR